MNIIDIVLLALGAWAVYAGFRDGLVVQAGGILSLAVGLWLAFRYAADVGQLFGLHAPEGAVVGFIVVLVIVIIVVAVVSRLLRGVFRLTGFGIFDSLLGAVLSLLKAAVIVSLLICAIDALDTERKVISQKKIDSSRFYTPLREFSGRLFPVFDEVREQVMQGVDTLGGNNGPEQNKNSEI